MNIPLLGQHRDRLERLGDSEVRFPNGRLESLFTERYSGTRDGIVVRVARLTGRFRIRGGPTARYEDLPQLAQAEAVEKVAWYARSCRENGVELFR